MIKSFGESPYSGKITQGEVDKEKAIYHKVFQNLVIKLD